MLLTVRTIPPLAIVILNFRTAGLVTDCLVSLEPEHRTIDFQVVVVDNASGDDSADRIAQAIHDQGWSNWVRLLRSPINGGFSAGNNFGIQSIEADGYLLLNSDTIVRPGAIKQLMTSMQQSPETGLYGPRLESPDGSAQVSCFRYPSFFSELIRGACTGPVTKLLQRWNVPIQVEDRRTEVQWVSFAAVLIRRQVLETVGPMDDGYFMYYEDTDYCHRVSNAGWKIRYCPEARIVHLHGQSSGLSELNAALKRRPHYYYAARARYFRKWSGKMGVIKANLGWCAGRVIGVTRELFGRRRTSCEREWVDNWLYWKGRTVTASTGNVPNDVS